MNERRERQGGTRSKKRNDQRTYTQFDLASLPLNPKRWRYVLNRLLNTAPRLRATVI